MGSWNALAFLELFPSRRQDAQSLEEWGTIVDSFMDRQFESTMGRLIRRLGERTAVPEDLESQLAGALNARNRLAHSFFRDYAEELLTRSGRDAMIADVDACRAGFEAADDALSSVVDPLRRQVGVSDENVAEALNALISSAKQADAREST